MTTDAPRVRGTTTNEAFGVREDRACVVLHEFWHNGEGWFLLRDVETGEQFDSPDVFWTAV